MKKLLSLMLMVAVPVAVNAAANVNAKTSDNAKPQINKQVLAEMLNIQKQQVGLQNQLLTIQSTLLQLSKKQLQLQSQLLTAHPTAAKNFKWVTDKEIPSNAINAGLDGGIKVYICHAPYQDFGIHPGTLSPKGCIISYAGVAYVQSNYQLLTGDGKIAWKPSSALYQVHTHTFPLEGPGPVIAGNTGLYPQNSIQDQPQGLPIVGGHEKNHNLYICRAILNNQIHVGKVVAGNCNIGYDGKEVALQNYQVLFGN